MLEKDKIENARYKNIDDKLNFILENQAIILAILNVATHGALEEDISAQANGIVDYIEAENEKNKGGWFSAEELEYILGKLRQMQ